MNTRIPLLIVLAASLQVGCGQGAADVTGPATPVQPGSVADASGSIDIRVDGSTVAANSRGDANSVQCQLGFTAHNRSNIDVKSLIVSYNVVRRSSGETIKTGWQMVIPSGIKAGATAAPYGSEPIDDVACDDLLLSFTPQPSYQCRTESKAKCPSFTYQGSSVTVEELR